MNLKVKQFKKRYGFTPLDILKMRVNLHSRHYLTRQECPNSLRYLTGFTIIELLTVMSIIVILFGLLMPAMNLVRTYSKNVKQSAQFHAIESALQMFHDDFKGYPPSDAMDRDATTGNPTDGSTTYPGTCKLGEALLGRDLLGFNPNSIFRDDGKNTLIADTEETGGQELYPSVTVSGSAITDQKVITNLQMRKGPYVDVTKVTAATVRNLYGTQATLDPNALVICDEFPRVRIQSSGKRVGLPVLYYKANISSMLNPLIVGGLGQGPLTPQDTTFIYNYLDNDTIVGYTPPFGGANPMAGSSGAVKFYTEIQNPKISSPPKPYNADTYILMSAGPDGLYGTRDDVFNFTKD